MSAPPAIEILPENLHEDQNALRAYLELTDLRASMDPHSEDFKNKKQMRMEQALSYVQNDLEQTESRLTVGLTTSEILRIQQQELETQIAGEADAALLALYGRTQEVIAAHQAEVDAIVAALRAEVDAKAGADTKEDVTAIEEAEPKGFVQNMENLAIGIANVLPEKTIAGWSREKKRNIGIAMTLGTVTVAALGAMLWQHGKESAAEGRRASNAGKGILAAAGIGILAFFGFKMYQNMEDVKKLAKNAKDMAGGVVDKVTDAATSGVDAAKKWWDGEGFGLQKEDYEDAEQLYRERPANWKEKIAVVFEVKKGEEQQQNYELFLQEMDRKYVPEDVGSFQYSRIDGAMENYKTGLSIMLGQFEHWVEHNKVKVAVGTYLAYRFGVLHAILRSGKSAMEIVLSLANTMRKWGMSHPFAAMFILGGSIFTFYGLAKKSKKEVKLPENLVELLAVANSSADIAIGDMGGVGSEQLEKVKELAKKIGVINGDIFAWAGEQAMHFCGEVLQSLPERIGLSDEEVIFRRQDRSLKELEDQLTKERKRYTDSNELRDKAHIFDPTLSSLQVYSEVYMRERCVLFSESDDPVSALSSLQSALSDAGIEISNKNGIVSWYWREAGEETMLSLCVDPAITDKNKILDRAQNLDVGDAVTLQVFSEMAEHGRMEFQEEIEKYGGGWVGIVSGSMLYCIDPRNIGEYVMVPVDIASQILSTATTDDAESNAQERKAISHTVIAGTTQTIMYQLSTVVVSRLKRYIVGGGPVYRGMFGGVKRVLQFVPVTSQLQYAGDLTRLRREAGIVGKYGVARGRIINSMITQSKIRPEWLLRVEKATDTAELKQIAQLMDNLQLNSNTLAGMKKEIKEYVELLFRKTRVYNGINGRYSFRKKTFHKADEYIDDVIKYMSGDVVETVLDEADNLARTAGTVDDALPSGVGRVVDQVDLYRYVADDLDDLIDINKPQHNELIKRIASSDNPDVLIARCRKEGIDTVADMFRLDDAAKVVGHLDDSTPVYLAKLVEAANGNHDAMQALSHLDDAKIMAVVADEAGDVTKAVAKLGVIGKAARVLSGVAFVGDVFAIAFAGYEAYNTSILIEATPEGELRDEYSERYYYHGAEAAVGGVGLVAGVVGIAAAGTTAGAIAAPVALATLPVSMTIGALYQRHKFHEDLARGVEDWKRENDPHQNLANMRTLGFGEALGQETNIMLQDGNWIFYSLNTGMPILDASLVKLKHKIIMRKTQETRAEQQQDIDEMNRKMVQAIVEESDFRVPITVRDPVTKKERALIKNDVIDEVGYYEGCKKAYEEGKMQYLMEYGQEILFHGGDMQEGLGYLLKNAEVYARLQHYRYATAHIGMIVLNATKIPVTESVFPDESLSMEEQSHEYQVLSDKQAIAKMIVRAIAGIAEGNEREVQGQIKTMVIPILQQRTMPHILAFRTKIRETNFEFLWLDGDRSTLTELHTLDFVQDVLDAQADKIAESVINTARSSDQVSSEDMIEGLWQNLASADMRINSYLQNPKARWKDLKGDKKRFARVQEHFQKQTELAEVKGNIEELRHKVADHKNKHVPAGRAGALLDQQRNQEKQRLERYEKILKEHPQWLEKNPL